MVTRIALPALLAAAIVTIAAQPGITETAVQYDVVDLPAALASRSIPPEPAGPDAIAPEPVRPLMNRSVHSGTGVQEAPAPPPSSPETAAQGERRLTPDDYFALGEESYEIGDYARAGEYHGRYIELGTDRARLAKSHERLAFVHAAFGEMESVYEEFVASLTLDSGLALDQDLVSPKVYEAFLKARENVVHEGILIVNSDPDGAEVSLDGEPIGEAPVRKERVPEGEYKLRLAKPGWESSEGTVVIKKDVTLTIDEKMVRARGTLSIASDPPGAQAVVDGRPAGATPLVIENVSGGRHALSFKSDYFEPLEAEVVMEKGAAAEYIARLRRRLLVVTESGPGMDADSHLEGPLGDMAGVSVIKADPAGLAARLTERGLDPGSVEFLLERKSELSLEDAAALSGVMEEDRAQLALVAELRGVEGGYELGLMLYSTASLRGDGMVYRAADDAGIREGFARFARMWSEVAGPDRPAAGLRLVERASGGVEVISVTPGLPGAEAGILPGDIITTVDGAPVGSKAGFMRMTAGLAAHEIGYERRGSAGKTVLTTAMSPIETPPDSGEYLYNLALVQYEGYLENVPAPEDGAVDDARGAAALNLGNVYQHMGEYDRAVKAYSQAVMSAGSGICSGTAHFRAGQAYEKMGMWSEAANSYRKAMLLYPGATIGSADGQPVAPLALERMKYLYEAGLTREKWWL